MGIFNKIGINTITVAYAFILCLLLNNTSLFSQQQDYSGYRPVIPEYFVPQNHNPNIKSLPQKSFYQSRDDWQYIIDTTWGQGAPFSQKQLIYNTYAQKVHDEFDGFLSLGLNFDSLYYHYLPEITDSTSAGAFAAIMAHFAYDLQDLHTRATYNIIEQTPLNPGIPILVLGSYSTVEHFGAVTTVLPDSNTLVLRVVPNHPLNIEPGDIILGYEGIPWKDLAYELLDAGLPIIGRMGGCNTAKTYLDLSCAGMNWHLFSTIDILKHSTGDTVHLSVAPLLNLNVLPMVNNEQMPIDNIPFPDVLSNECATFGILDNTNIGYIYLAIEQPQATADAQFYNAVDSLRNTDALIIDMRLNFGGWALFRYAFNILFNDTYKTVEDAYRCDNISFQLCPSGDWNLFNINGMRPDFYERPIAILLGPTCVSMGDLTAQRMRYHPMVKFFGKSPDASLGDNVYLNNFSDWTLRYSISDVFHTNEPDIYLNRREFPIDFPVWHNAEDVAIGKDAVVENALEWINNLVYPHEVFISGSYYRPGIDTLRITADIENPNDHSVTGRVYFYNISDELIDSVDLAYEKQVQSSSWSAQWVIPPTEETYKISVTAFDETESKSFTLPNTRRFTTAGPVTLDSISIMESSGDYYWLRPFVTNEGTDSTITNAAFRLLSNDPWAILSNAVMDLPDLPPGESVGASGWFVQRYIDSLLPNPVYFNINLEVMNDGWTYWKDSTRIVVGIAENNTQVPFVFGLEQNYPNPFNPETKIKYSIQEPSKVTLKVYDILGREISTLINENKSSGIYELNWNAANLPSGVYFYQLHAGEFVFTKKMILLK